jgi:hypothetical protein
MWRRFQPVERQSRAWQRDRAIVDAQLVGDIKWQWRQACEYSGLARMVYSPTGPTTSIPMIGKVSLGPPTTFTVRLQPGQLASDVQAAAPRIAEAMSVFDIAVSRIATGWVRVELIPTPACPTQAYPGRPGSSEVIPFELPRHPPADRGQIGA